MFRVSLANAFAHRTLRPLMEKHQATPVPVTLSATSLAQVIYSGMVAQLDAADGTVKLGANNVQAWGLFALDHNTVIDDLDGQPTDLAPFAVWQGGPDAYFRIDAPAFNTGGSIAVGSYMYCDSAGKLAISGQSSATNADGAGAQIVEIVSATRLVIRVLLPTAFDLGTSG